MILDEGLNEIRDLLYDNLTAGQSGTGTTLPTTADTGLETPVAATLNTLSSKTKTDKMLTVNHLVDSSEANSSTLTECEVRFSGGESLNRVVHAGISKTSDIEVEYITSFYITS